MELELKIFIDKLSLDQEEEITLVISPQFLEIEDKELIFDSPIEISGKCYVTNESFILQLQSKTQTKMPCSICNTLVNIDLEANEIYHSVFLEELSTNIFDYSSLVREELLLQVPPFAECENGNCPERKVITKYLKIRSPKEEKPSTQTHFPFADL